MARRGEGALWGAARLVGFAALGGLLLAAASIVPFGGLGLLVLAPFLASATSPRGQGRGALARPLAALIGSPALLGLPLFTLQGPVIGGGGYGTGLVGLLFVFPVLAFFTGVVATAGALGAVVVAPRWVARAAPILRSAALIAGGFLLAFAAVRSGVAPSPEDWVSTLPVVARREAPGPTLPLQVAGAPRVLLLRCSPDPCQAVLGDEDGESLPLFGDPIEVSAGAPLEVRAHEGLGVVVLVQGSLTRGAFDLESGRRTSVSLRAVGAEVAPSFLAIVALAVGLLVAAGRTRRGITERKAVARLLAGVSAFVDDAGVVHPDDESAAFRAPGPVLPEGPATILGRPGADAFRSAPDRGTWVLAGKAAMHLAIHRERAARFDLEATAAVALAGGPLVAAALLGLVL